MTGLQLLAELEKIERNEKGGAELLESEIWIVDTGSRALLNHICYVSSLIGPFGNRDVVFSPYDRVNCSCGNKEGI